MDKLEFLDTTIRDGELSPAFNPRPTERRQIAQDLDQAGIDVIELASTADDDLRRTDSNRIARCLKNARACCISQISGKHIEIARSILDGAAQPRIHLYLDARRVHRMAEDGAAQIAILEQVSAAIKTARNYFPEVQFSPQDATRAEQNSLFALVKAAIAAGADIINISDTTGTATPELIAQLMTELAQSVPEITGCRLSLHAHNHAGRATENALSAVAQGVRQVEGTIHGVGPAGGNTDLIDVARRLEPDLANRIYSSSADLKKLNSIGHQACFN